METLSAMVTKAVEEGLFGSLASISPLQKILVYADDVVMFLKLECRELWAVRHILSLFGEASGLQVNFRKTTAMLIRGTHEEERTTWILGCELARFPIRYLGLVKILKYDKRTRALVRLPFIQNMLLQPFFTTDLLYQLVKECEAMLDQLLP
ncbi:hypothetical protein ACQ4PT_040463 [Festuca glaucescens]